MVIKTPFSAKKLLFEACLMILIQCVDSWETQW